MNDIQTDFSSKQGKDNAKRDSLIKEMEENDMQRFTDKQRLAALEEL